MARQPRRHLRLPARPTDRRPAESARDRRHRCATRYLIDLLGPVPIDQSGVARWAQLAGGVEAYREEWGVEPDHLDELPLDGTQTGEWDTAVRRIGMINRLDALLLDRGLDRGLGIEL